MVAPIEQQVLCVFVSVSSLDLDLRYLSFFITECR